MEVKLCDNCWAPVKGGIAPLHERNNAFRFEFCPDCRVAVINQRWAVLNMRMVSRDLSPTAPHPRASGFGGHRMDEVEATLMEAADGLRIADLPVVQSIVNAAVDHHLDDAHSIEEEVT